MKVIANIGTTKDGRSVLVIEKTNGIEIVIASGYDPSQPEGSQWQHGTYVTSLHDMASILTYTEMVIGYGRLVEIASRAIDALRDNDEEAAQEYCRDELDMDDDELKFFGLKEQMTIEEYDEKMSEYGEKLRENYSDELFREVSAFQKEHMEDVLYHYEKTIGDDPKKQVCYDLLEYAIHDSESGSAIVDADFVTNENEAAELQDAIFEEIGQYLLDDCQVYKEKGRGYVADVMFGGNYVPYWDGWRD